MAHVLNKLTGVNIQDIKTQLAKDKEEHARQGIYLEHIWQNADNDQEVYFLFRVDNLDQHRELMRKIHEQARANSPDITLPEKLFLEEI